MLRYNISSNREPDNRRVIVILSSAVLLLTLFITVGLLIQSRDRAEIVRNNDKLDALSLKIESTTAKAGDYRKVIAANKSRFGQEVDYINRLIGRSSTPFIKMFDKIEALLPPTVSARKIQISQKRGFLVTLESETMAPLIKILEKMPEQKLIVSEPNRKRNENYYTATISVGVKNEKK